MVLKYRMVRLLKDTAVSRRGLRRPGVARPIPTAEHWYHLPNRSVTIRQDRSSRQGGSKMAERGRPRAFDEDEVLDVAMRLFWDHGFDGTSMSDLTEAMGINRRSIYAAFGNKEALFTAALEHYLAGPGAFVDKARALPTAREVAEAFLRGSVEAFTSSDRPAGCMARSEEHTSELQSHLNLVCRLLLEKKKQPETIAPERHLASS